MLGTCWWCGQAPTLAAQTPGADRALVRAQQKISSTSGNFPEKLGKLTGFGWAAEAVGDIDGNGVPDLAAGAHFDDVGHEDTGTVRLLLLQRDGQVERVLKINSESGGFAGPLGLDDVFGWSIASLGDLDGDGVVDLAVGAPGDDDSAVDAGAVYILFLKPDGSVRRQQKISAREGWARRRPWTWLVPPQAQGGFLAALEPYENFGVAVEAIGDLDGDGNVDLAVGARTGGDSDRLRGAVWILFLQRDGTVKSHRRLDAASAALADSLREKDEFGFSLASIGDLDGDGLAELAVGARGDDDGGLDYGAVYILFLDRHGAIRRASKISARAGNFDGQLSNQSEFGIALSVIPDWNGDGLPELLVGARGDDEVVRDAGAAWMLSLAADGTVRQARKITAGREGFDGTLDRWDRFGTGLASLGDLDGDGAPELVVGAEGDDDHTVDSGAIWILFMQSRNEAP